MAAREEPHLQIYPLHGPGEVHLFATGWLPGALGLYWQDVQDRACRVSPLDDGARFFWTVPDYVWVDQVAAALPDLAHPEVTARMAWLVHHAGRGPHDALAPGGRQLLPGPGSGWRYQVGGLAAIIRRIEERIAAREWFVTPLWQPQYLNRVHRLRPPDDPRGVFPAAPGLVDREPRRVRSHAGSPAADPVHPRRRDGHGLRRQRRGGEHAAGRPTLDGAAPRSGAGLAQLIGTIT